ncbi:MAG TPA: glycosyltransferase [Candidatus Nanopelagicales bacterium]|nr:glycosyltransferase [Candidatus Nanopelagicales bacterium]
MKITLLALGSRGDVQPAVALGKGLAARGHAVRVLAGNNFHAFIAGHGLETIPAAVDMQAIMESDLGREWVARGTNPLAQNRIMQELLDRHGWAMVEDVHRACEGAELIVSSFTSDVYAASIAEASGAAHVSALLQPSPLATRHGPAALAPIVPGRDSVLNLLFGKLVIERTLWGWYEPLVNRLRTERLGLSAQNRRQGMDALRRMPVVHGYSGHVSPRAPDWPTHYDVAGYWFLDEGGDYQPPEALRRFLDAGEPPVCLGFGSMSAGDPAALTRLFVEAAAQSGRRAILLSGWSALGGVELPESILRLDAVPHDWLYPRVAAVVTHGGAGTTGASLRAGRPTIVVPHMADQIYWGRRVAELGVGPAAILRPRLRADNLAAAIREATGDAGMRRRAEELGKRIREEDGVGRAVTLIERPVEAHAAERRR